MTALRGRSILTAGLVTLVGVASVGDGAAAEHQQASSAPELAATVLSEYLSEAGVAAHWAAVDAMDDAVPPAGPAPLQPSDLGTARLASVGGETKHPKLSTHVLRLIDADRQARSFGGPITANSSQGLPQDLRSMIEARLLRIDDRGLVQVYVHPTDAIDRAVTAVEGAAGTVELFDDESRTIQARMEISRLQSLSDDPAIQLIRLPDYGVSQAGSVTSQGDSILRASLARSTLGVDGTGVRVGVISDGVGGIGTSQASGDLPAVNTTTCNIGPGNPQTNGAEGTAMLEIVHDLAPGAELWFGDFDFGTSVQFSAAVDCLALQTDIVVDDIAWFNAGPYDGTSTVSVNTSTELNRPTNRIRAYANAVGNHAERHYQESWVSCSGSTFQYFSATSTTNSAGGFPPRCDNPLIVPAGATIAVYLQWNDPFGGSCNDYDMYLYTHDGPDQLAFSGNPQGCFHNPTEGFAWQNPAPGNVIVDLVIDNFNGAAAPRTFDMFTHIAYPNFVTPSSSVPGNSDAGGGVISAGAINAADFGNDTIASYSSRGPTNDGRNKPDITGIDGVSITGAGGFSNPFYGTSAAAPHIGAIAALVLDCQPQLKAGEPGDNPGADRMATRNALLNGAVDLGAGGMDNVYGAGRADALNACRCAPPPPGGALPAAPAAYYHPITPARILETRAAPFGPIGGEAGKLGHGCVKSVQVTDVGGVPPVSAGVSAVVVNVTVTEPTLPSHLTIYPSNTSLPNAANLNFVAGQTVPNLVTVRVGTDGYVNVFNNSGQTHVIFDVVGWYGEPTGGSRYNAITPKRILDTRGSPYGPIGFTETGAAIPASQLGHGGVMTIDVTNTYGSGVPNSVATAVAVNVTVTGPSAASHLTVYPSDAASAPNAANLNFVAGQTVPNLVIVKAGPAGGGSVKVRNNSGSTHVIFDIVGWYGASSGDVFNPLPPARIMDTRVGQGWGGALGHGGIAAVDVTNTYGSGVPDPPGASAVIVNTTVTQPTAPSHLTIYPSDAPLPNAANLNFVAEQTVPNLVIVKVGADGKVNVRNNSGSTHAIFDVAGYFEPAP